MSVDVQQRKMFSRKIWMSMCMSTYACSGENDRKRAFRALYLLFPECGISSYNIVEWSPVQYHFGINPRKKTRKS